MPFYEFKCRECNKTQEKLVKMDTKEIACDCSENAVMERQFSGKFNGHGLPNGFSATRSKSRSK